MNIYSGNISKMQAELKNSKVHYSLPVGGELVSLNELIGKNIKLTFNGNLNCSECNAKADKLFGDGVCFHCHSTLAKCDMCRIKPETCHYDKGTCREPKWGEDNCLQPHVVYLSYTSGYKVGITRGKNIPSRWIDQGAIKAVPLFYVKSRLISGLIEEAMKPFVGDKTFWSKMLRNEEAPSDNEFSEKARHLIEAVKDSVDTIHLNHGKDAILEADAGIPVLIQYPISAPAELFTEKKAHKLDVESPVTGVFHGIKGQYLFIGESVISVRKYIGYDCDISV